MLCLFIIVVLLAGGISSAEHTTLPLHAEHGLFSSRDVTLSSGTITGRVLDIKGQPIFNAEVLAINAYSGSAGKIPTTYTNRKGVFRIKGLPPGTYRVSAAKEEDGYSPTYSLFHSAGFVQAPEVTIYKGQTISGLVIHLGPKAARLVGRIVDAMTNKPIAVQDKQITLRRLDLPDNPYMTGPDEKGKFNILVPPVPFTIEVTAPGYEKKKLKHLHLMKGVTKRLDIALNPAR